MTPTRRGRYIISCGSSGARPYIVRGIAPLSPCQLAIPLCAVFFCNLFSLSLLAPAPTVSVMRGQAGPEGAAWTCVVGSKVSRSVLLLA
ncbi:hypothetical protein BaRGS_00012075 [Batillaria attramentaria]|uniref:Uncharacterized protein n=1 Tax=Batillaria attramentaria TaxID=370345 RepID=A0ABD0LBQ6_9CAEN